MCGGRRWRSFGLCTVGRRSWILVVVDYVGALVRAADSRHDLGNTCRIRNVAGGPGSRARRYRYHLARSWSQTLIVAQTNMKHLLAIFLIITASYAAAAPIPTLRDGDIIFQTSLSSQTVTWASFSSATANPMCSRRLQPFATLPSQAGLPEERAVTTSLSASKTLLRS